MAEDTNKYVVLFETKQEQGLVMETPLASATYDHIEKQMRRMANDKNVIRVAVAQLVYVTGNEALLPPERAEETVEF